MKNTRFKRLLTLVLAVMMITTAMPINLLADAGGASATSKSNFKEIVYDDKSVVRKEDYINEIKKLPIEPVKLEGSETATDKVKNPDQPAIYTVRTDYKSEKGEKYSVDYQPYVASVGANASDEQKAKVNNEIKLPKLAGYEKPKGPDFFKNTYQDIFDKAKSGHQTGDDANGKKYLALREYDYSAISNDVVIKDVFQDLEDFNRFVNPDGTITKNDGTFIDKEKSETKYDLEKEREKEIFKKRVQEHESLRILTGNTGSTLEVQALQENKRPGFVPQVEKLKTQVPEDTTDFKIEFRYNRAHYDVVFDTQEGTPLPARTYYYDQEIPKIDENSIPTKEGCEFQGWKPSHELKGKDGKTYKKDEIIKDASGNAIVDLGDTYYKRDASNKLVIVGGDPVKEHTSEIKLMMPALKLGNGKEIPREKLIFTAVWKDKEKADYAVQFWVEKADHADGASLQDKYEYMGTRVYKDKDTGLRPDLDKEPVNGLKFPDLDQARLQKIWKGDRFNRGHDLYLNKFFVYNKDLTDKENADSKNPIEVKKVSATGKTVYNIYFDRQVYDLYFTKSNKQPEQNTIYPEIWKYDEKKGKAVKAGGPGNPYHYKARFNEIMYKWPNDAKQTKGFTPGYQSFGWGPNYERPNWPVYLDTPPYRLNADQFLDMENYTSWGGYVKHIDKGDGTTIDLDPLDFKTLSFGIKQDNPSIPHHMDFWMDGFKKDETIIRYDLVRTKADTAGLGYGHKYPKVTGFTPYDYNPRAAWPAIAEGSEENGRVNEDEINELNDERDEITPNNSGSYYNNFGTKLTIGQLDFIAHFFSDSDEFGDVKEGGQEFEQNGYLQFHYKRNKYPLRFNYDPTKIKADSEFFYPKKNGTVEEKNKANALETFFQFPLKCLSPDVDTEEEYKKVAEGKNPKNLLDDANNLYKLGLYDLLQRDKTDPNKFVQDSKKNYMVKRPTGLASDKVFKGWALDPDGKKMVWKNSKETMPFHPTNLYAIWGDPDASWKLTVDPNGGELSSIDLKDLTTDKKKIKEGDIGKEEENEYPVKGYKGEELPSGNANVDKNKAQVFTVAHKQVLKELPKPSRYGYDFLGWEVIRYKKDTSGKYTKEQDNSYFEKYHVPELYSFGTDVVSPIYLRAIWVENKRADVKVYHYFLKQDFSLDTDKFPNPEINVLDYKRVGDYVPTTGEKQDSHWILADNDELLEKLNGTYKENGTDVDLKPEYEAYEKRVGLKNTFFQTFRVQENIVDKKKSTPDSTVYKANPENIFRFYYRPFRTRKYKVNYLDERGKEEVDKFFKGLDLTATDGLKGDDLLAANQANKEKFKAQRATLESILNKYKIIDKEKVTSQCRHYDARNYRRIPGWTLVGDPQQQLFYDVNEDTNEFLGINGTGSNEIYFYYKDVRTIEVKNPKDKAPEGYVRVTFKADEGGSFGKDDKGNDIKELNYDVIEGLYSDNLVVPEQLKDGESKVDGKYYITPDNGKNFIKWDEKPLLNPKTILNNTEENFYVFTAKFTWQGLTASPSGLVRTEAFKDPENKWTNDFAPKLEDLKKQLVWKEKGVAKDIPEGTTIKYYDENDNELTTDEDIFNLVKEQNKPDKEELVRTVKIKAKVKFKDGKDTQNLDIPITVYKNVYEALTGTEKPLFLKEAELKEAKDGGLENVSGAYVKVTVNPTGDASDKDSKIYYVNPKAWVSIPEIALSEADKTKIKFLNWTADVDNQNEDAKKNGIYDFSKRHKFTKDTVIKPFSSEEIIEQTDPNQKLNVPDGFVKVIVKLTDKAKVLDAESNELTGEAYEKAITRTFWVKPKVDLNIPVTKPLGKTVKVAPGVPKEFSWKFTKWTSNDSPQRSWSENIDSGIRAQFVKDETIITANYTEDVLKQGTLTADELTVHESYKDGSTVINDFITSEASKANLVGAIKIINASGIEEDLPQGAKVSLLDDTKTEFRDDDALKNALYDKLKEKDNTNDEPTRLEKINAKVTFKNGEVQEVAIPIRVIKNIYEAKTLTDKPYYVPDTYKKVTLDPSTKAENPQKTYYYVNPQASVVIPGSDPVGRGINTFIKWTIVNDEYKLGQRYKFTSDTLIQAQYSNDVVPADNSGNKPAGTPERFVKVTFVPTSNGVLSGDYIFYVNPDKKVSLPVKDPEANGGYTFKEWKMGVSADGAVYLPSEEQEFKADTIITATYTKDLIEQVGSQKPSDVPDSHIQVKVEYTDMAELKNASGTPLTGEEYEKAKTRIFWVEPNKEVTLPVLKPVGKAVAANGSEKAYMYQFTKWTSDETPLRSWTEDIENGIKASFSEKTVITANYDKKVQEQGSVIAKELTVHESYKDGSTVINDFITSEASKANLVGAIKIINASGIEEDLPQGAKVSLLDDNKIEFINDDALKNALYDKLKEKDNANDEPTRLEKINAKVTFKNGEVQEVTIPIRVIKNIYEAKTLTKKPYYVPDGYIKVELNPTSLATDPQKTYYYVNPQASVVIPGSDPVGRDKNKFIKWTMKADDESGKGADYNLSDRHKFEKASTITAIYSADVVPQEGTEKPDGVPENFVEVTFVPTDKGTMEGAKTFWVKPDTEVTIPVNDPVGKQYFTFKEWKIGDAATGVKYEAPTKFIAQKTTIIAVYEEAKNIIPYDPSKIDPMPRPVGYARVSFTASEGLKLKDIKYYYVKKSSGVKLGDIKNASIYGYPKYDEEIGYKFKNWDKEDSEVIGDLDVVVNADARDLPDYQEKTSSAQNKPDKRYVTVTFKAEPDEHGTVTEKVYYVNPKKYVQLKAPNTKAEQGYEFVTWSTDSNTIKEFSLANYIKYEEDTNLYAKFNPINSVIPVVDASTQKPNGFVTVTFTFDAQSKDHGKFDGTTTYYVDPKRDITLSPPLVDPNIGYEFVSWNHDATQTQKYAQDKTIECTLKKLEDIIKAKDSDTDADIPRGYVLVYFYAGEGGVAEGQAIYYVNPKAGKIVGDLGKPTVVENTGFKFTGWDTQDNEAIKGNKIINAKYDSIGDSILVGPGTVKPKGYVEVKFVAGDHGSVEDRKYYVNPDKYVALEAPNPIPEPYYEFSLWSPDVRNYTKYTKDTKITAHFRKQDLVIPKGNETSKGPDYVVVSFKIKHDQESRGSLDGVKEYFVKKDTEVTINPPRVIANTGFEFETWSIDTTKPMKYSIDTSVEASFTDFGPIIPSTDNNGATIARPRGYLRVRFLGGKNGQLSGETTYYVNPSGDKTLGDIPKPKIIANTGYDEDGWDKDDSFKIKGTDDIVVTAKYKALEDIITAGPNQTAPKGYVVIIFKTDNNGTMTSNIKDDEGKKLVDVNEIVYFVNPSKKIKLVNSRTTNPQELQVPSTKANTNYKFETWFETINTEDPIIRGRIYVAKFKSEEFTLTYDKNGATEGSVPSESVAKHGANVRLAGQGTLKKSGYSFAGWKIGDKIYQAGERFNLTEDTTAFAKWKPDDLIIKYDPDEPTARPNDTYVRVKFEAERGLNLSNVNYYYVKKDSVKLEDIKNNNDYGYPQYNEETGYKFDKWEASDKLTDTEAITKDVVIRAKATSLPDYQEKTTSAPNKPDDRYVTVTFKADPDEHGTVKEKVYYVNPNKYVKLTPPSGDDVKANTGYVFASWSSDAEVPTQYKNDTVITASFRPMDAVSTEAKPNYVELVFKIEGEGGSILEHETTTYYVDPNRDVTLSAPKYKEEVGYKFKSWSIDTTKPRMYKSRTEIIGTFEERDNVIPATDDAGKPNPKPEGYVKVIFVSSSDGRLYESAGMAKKQINEKVYYVNPKTGQIINALTKPEADPNEGFKKADFVWHILGTTEELTDAELNNKVITADMTLIAQYKALPDVVVKEKPDETDKPEGYITVKFDAGDHGSISKTNKTIKEVYINKNKLPIVLRGQEPDITPETGYLFTGWDKEINTAISYKDGDTIKAEYTESENIATVQKPGYVKVVFMEGDNGSLDGLTTLWVKPGVEVNIPQPKVNPNIGYNFKKWDNETTVKLNANQSPYIIKAEYEGIGDIVAADKAQPNGYVKVEFKADENGSLDGTTVYYVNPLKEVDLNSTAEAITKKANTGFTAAGATWAKTSGKDLKDTFTDPVSTFTFDFNNLPDVSTTVKYPGYVKVEFIAGANGSIVGGDKVYYVNPLKKLKVGSNEIPKPQTTPGDNYVLDSWYEDIKTDEEITTDKKFVARFKLNKATMTYKASDATEGTVPQALQYDIGTDITLAGGNDLKRNNYLLKGWEIDGTIYAPGEKYTINANTTAKAVWEEDLHTVTFNTDGGSYIATQKVKHKDKIVSVSNPTKEGYTFIGWKLNGTKFSVENDIVESDITLTAQYVANVIEEVGGTAPLDKPGDFVKVIVDKTKKAKIASGEKQIQTFWVKKNTRLTIEVKDPIGDKVAGEVDASGKDLMWKFKTWSMPLTNIFTENETTITAQYEKVVPELKVTADTIVTAVDIMPSEEDYKKHIKAQLGDENPNFTVVQITKQPNVNVAGKSDAKVLIRFDNLETREVTVPVLAIAEVVEQIGVDKPVVPENYAKVIVDTTVLATDNTYFKKTFWVKPCSTVWIPVNKPTGKEALDMNGVMRTNAFLQWKRLGDPVKYYDSNITDNFGENQVATIVAEYEKDVDTPVQVKDGQWVNVGAVLKPEDFVSNLYDGSYPYDKGKLPPGTKVEFLPGKEADTSEVGQKTTSIVVIYPNGKREVQNDITYNVRLDYIEQIGSEEPAKPDNFVKVTISTKEKFYDNGTLVEKVKATPDTSFERIFWVDPTKEVSIEISKPKGLVDTDGKTWKLDHWQVLGSDGNGKIYNSLDKITDKFEPETRIYAIYTKEADPTPEPHPEPQPDQRYPEIIYRDRIVEKEKIVEKIVKIKDNERLKEIRYMQGFDGKFRPYDGLRRCEAAQILANALRADGNVYNNNYELKYTDVGDAWYTDAIRVVTQAGVFNGYNDGTFKPNGKITRAEWIATLRRFQNLTKKSGNDMNLSLGHWATEEVEAAYQAGWLDVYTSGVAGFIADTAITRQEVASISNKAFGRVLDKIYLERNVRNMINYKDINPSMPLYEDILCASNTLLTDGKYYKANAIVNDNVTFNIVTDDLVIYQKKFQILQ